MGRSLGMEVIAEGVGIAGQLRFPAPAAAATSPRASLFGEPCTADELLALLARQAAGTAPFAHLLRHTEADASSRLA